MSRMTFFSSGDSAVSEKETLVFRLSMLTENGNSLLRQIEKNEEKEKYDSLQTEFDKNLERIRDVEQQLAKIVGDEKKTEAPDSSSSSVRRKSTL